MKDWEEFLTNERPIAPSAEFEARVAARIAVSPSTRRVVSFPWKATAAGALVGLLLLAALGVLLAENGLTWPPDWRSSPVAPRWGDMFVGACGVSTAILCAVVVVLAPGRMPRQRAQS